MTTAINTTNPLNITTIATIGISQALTHSPDNTSQSTNPMTTTTTVPVITEISQTEPQHHSSDKSPNTNVMTDTTMYVITGK